jgi:nitrogen fixation/metabolism regulation signal transduction histidine kinase
MDRGPIQRRGVCRAAAGAARKSAGRIVGGRVLREQIALERSILWTGVIVGGSGIFIGVLLGWWTTERITRPVERLAEGARAVAGGDWSAHVDVLSNDEIGELARAFNQMTQQLLEHRERAIQAERVAAWRELARRLAHELKNPLFPLQITIENLQRARANAPSGPEFRRSFSREHVDLARRNWRI